MEFFVVIQAISVIVAFIFGVGLLIDIAKTIVLKFRNKPYEWELQKLFAETNSGWTCLLLSATIVLGIFTMVERYGEAHSAETKQKYEYLIEEMEESEPELKECDFCFERFPEEYEFIDPNSGKTVCPNCVYEDYKEITSPGVGRCSNCGIFFNEKDSYGFGLCWDCAQKLITECQGCGEYTYRWNYDRDFTLCPNCMGEAMESANVERAIDNWFEYG